MRPADGSAAVPPVDAYARSLARFAAGMRNGRAKQAALARAAAALAAPKAPPAPPPAPVAPPPAPQPAAAPPGMPAAGGHAHLSCAADSHKSMEFVCPYLVLAARLAVSELRLHAAGAAAMGRSIVPSSGGVPMAAQQARPPASWQLPSSFPPLSTHPLGAGSAAASAALLSMLPGGPGRPAFDLQGLAGATPIFPSDALHLEVAACL
jgi:hypothetical protein